MRLLAFVVVMTGVTALCEAFRRALRRVRAREAALQRSEADLRMLLHHASDAIVITDAAGVIVEANEMACAVTGHARAALLGQPARALVRRDGDAPTSSALDGPADFRLRSRDGREVEVEVNATRFADGRVLAIARDVTERRRMETRLRQAHRLEALGQLAGSVSHDFNNIVAVIRASGELLLRELPGEGDARDDAVEIVRACDRATALTRQLLAFSRRRELVPALVEPDAVVHEMTRMLSLALGHRALRVETSAPGVAVLADRGQLEQVLMNLAVNAREAMPDGGTLSVRTEVATAGAGAATLALTVADSGVGMSPETLASIFEPFFTTREAGGGTGLGLATVQAIVDQAGGTIAVASEPGRGTTFRLTFPVAAMPVALPAGTATPATVAPPVRPAGRAA